MQHNSPYANAQTRAFSRCSNEHNAISSAGLPIASAAAGEPLMSNNQIVGIVLLVVASILLFLGYQASQSMGEQVVESFTGRFTDSTTWYFILGAAAAVGGLLLVAVRR